MFRLFARLVAAACLSPLAAAPALAQQGLSLHDAQRFALARSQQLTAQDAAAASVREMGMAAGQLPDPVLKFGVDNLPITGPDRFSLTQDFMTQRRIGVMQEITRADKRRLKVERVERDAQRIQAERELAAAVIRRDTALAWIEGYYAQATAELLRRQAEETRLQIQGAEIAYRAGRGSQADIFAARGALASLQDRVRQAERTVGSARLMLTRWVGAATGAQPLAGRAEWDQGAPPEWTLDHLRGHPSWPRSPPKSKPPTQRCARPRRTRAPTGRWKPRSSSADQPTPT